MTQEQKNIPNSFQHSNFCSVSLLMAENEAIKAELLEALENMLKKYGGMYDEWQQVDISARHAIAKAKGGEK